MRVQRDSCPLRRLTASSAASCALYALWRLLCHQCPCTFSVAAAPSARPQSGPIRPQHTPFRHIMSNPCPPPRGIKVINSTIATHRPVDDSSPCRLFIALWITHRPVDYSSRCGLLFSPVHSLHAVRCRQCSSRRPPPLSCRLLTLPGSKVALKADASTDTNHLFPSASRPLSSWQ